MKKIFLPLLAAITMQAFAQETDTLKPQIPRPPAKALRPAPVNGELKKQLKILQEEGFRVSLANSKTAADAKGSVIYIYNITSADSSNEFTSLNYVISREGVANVYLADENPHYKAPKTTNMRLACTWSNWTELSRTCEAKLNCVRKKTGWYIFEKRTKNCGNRYTEQTRKVAKHGCGC